MIDYVALAAQRNAERFLEEHKVEIAAEKINQARKDSRARAAKKYYEANKDEEWFKERRRGYEARYKTMPEVLERRNARRRERMATDPEFAERKRAYVRNHYKNHPEIYRNRIEKEKVEKRENPYFRAYFNASQAYNWNRRKGRQYDRKEFFKTFFAERGLEFNAELDSRGRPKRKG